MPLSKLILVPDTVPVKAIPLVPPPSSTLTTTLFNVVSYATEVSLLVAASTVTGVPKDIDVDEIVPITALA